MDEGREQQHASALPPPAEAPQPTGDGSSAVSVASPEPVTAPTVQCAGAQLTKSEASELLSSVLSIAEANVAPSTAWFSTDSSTAVAVDASGSAASAFPIRFTSNFHLVVNVAGYTFHGDVLKFILRALLLALMLLLIWLALGPSARPGGAVFATVTTILFGALVGTVIARALGFPPLIGYLMAGILWGAMGLSSGLSTTAYSCVRTAALTTILCRAGINFKWSAVKPVLGNVVLLGVAPQVTEVLAHAAVARLMFPQHTRWLTALIQGAMVAPASNAVIITVTTPLRAQGYSVARGPTLYVYVACAMDNVFGVWFINFLLGLMFPTAGTDVSMGKRVLLGLGQVVLGAICGIVGGHLMVLYGNLYFRRHEQLTGYERECAEKVSRRDAALFILLSQAALILGSNILLLPGTGTVAAAVTAGTIAHKWCQSGQESRKNDLNATLAGLWDVWVAPALFSLVGGTINLNLILSSAFLPPALLCILVGLVCKAAVVFAVQTGAGVLLREKGFVAIAMCAKATVQAALGSRFLDLATTAFQNLASDESESASDVIAQGVLVQQMSVFALLLCAVASGVAMKVTGPMLLVKDAEFVDRHREHSDDKPDKSPT